MLNVVKRRAVVPVAVALALGASGIAYAKVITGTPGNDRIRGSNQADSIDARAGHDRVFARGGADRVVLGSWTSRT